MASTPSREVAVIGAGPAGLTAARWLLACGLDPVVFEAADDIGGQWRSTNPSSGVWPDMRANTSRVVTRFSDLDHPAGTPVFPHRTEVLDYLERYAELFGLRSRIRTSASVQRLEQAGAGGWTVRWREAGGPVRSAGFQRVVVAAGRHTLPSRPDIPGLDSFTGEGGVVHTSAYKDPARYRGLRVLVAGGAISALEVASDLAMLGAARVSTASRRQRYVIPKLIAGLPSDHSRFTRFGALASETLAPEINAARFKAWLLAAGADPVRYGAPPAAEDPRLAGIALSQDFLPLVAEGRIDVRPWIAEVDGRTVRFTDGTTAEFDAILLGTGFKLDLGFLGDEVRQTLDLDERHIDLADATFHPALPGLAFTGFYSQSGPYFPVLELQARWIAYAWSGVRPPPGAEAMDRAIAAYRMRRGQPQDQQMHLMAVRFARLAGVESEVAAWPQIARALLFGPLAPDGFRLSGPDSLAEAPERLARQAAMLGAVTSPTFSDDEAMLVSMLAEQSSDQAVKALAWFTKA